MKQLLILIAVFGVSLFAFTRIVAPPRQLTLLDRFWPGDAPVTRIVDGETFDPANGLKLDVWAPEGDSAAKRPVMVFFYGGGWANGERAHYEFAGRAFAAQGFVTVVPDYRKVPKVRFPAFNQDGAAAIKWVRDNIARFGGDPEKIAVSGHSAGAYIAIMLALDPRYLTEVGVDPKTIKAGIGLSGPYDFIPFDSKRSINAMSKWPRPLETQPVTYVRKDAPPLMLVTGTEDETVKPRNAIILSQRLNGVGATVAFRAHEGLDHNDIVMALSLPFRNKAPVLDDAVAFLTDALNAKGE
jgi:acetyl esterase/lipase